MSAEQSEQSVQTESREDDSPAESRPEGQHEAREAMAETYPPDEDDGHTYADREQMDFDPAMGLYSGTAVEGTTEIPGPHEHVEDRTEDGTDDDGAADERSDSGGDADEPE
jgi:hypothetical protein